MKRNVHDQKMAMVLPQGKKKQGNNENRNVKIKNSSSNRFLITINVLGSAGPLRFLVNEDDVVATVIDAALKSYAREGRLPVLGLDTNSFLLYHANAGSDGMNTYNIYIYALF